MVSDRERVADLIERLIASRIEEEQAAISVELNEICPDPQWSDYIFQSTDFYGPDDFLDIEAVTEKIFEYQPINLPPP